MLAYVFWHAPSDADRYEERLLAFHRALATDPPAGFRGSAVFPRAQRAWGDGYEDWYLVDDWTALGVLNAGAIDAGHRSVHDDVAHRSGWGAGAVYRLIAGEPDLAAVRGASYTDRRADGLIVWQRQMVLGPAPEWCAHTAEGDAAPLYAAS